MRYMYQCKKYIYTFQKICLSENVMTENLVSENLFRKIQLGKFVVGKIFGYRLEESRAVKTQKAVHRVSDFYR